MFRTFVLTIFLGWAPQAAAQNPHGASLKIDCAACHSPAGWEISREYWSKVELQKPTKSRTTGMPIPVDTTLFHHNKTTFPLTGRHAAADCRDCHEGLVFSNAKTDCNACHTDIHRQTAGNDCARCHSTQHWLVDNVQEIHFREGFPLTGVHAPISCEQCHVSESALEFGRNGNNCVDCHLTDFNASTNPNHVEAGFSTNCLDCHDIVTPDWGTDKVDHSFFPFTKGHAVNDCAACHTGGDFANTPTNCFACHQADFNGTTDPNHQQNQFPTACLDCHTESAWVPSTFNHNFYPMTGGHVPIQNDCIACHIGGNYNNTPNTCEGCHLPDYNTSSNPNHLSLNLPTDCDMCHTTDPDWNPATFPIHNQFWQFQGAHVAIQNDCVACHNGNYNNTPNTCYGCHQADYNSANNPNHQSAGFPTDCTLCHTQTAWDPSSFDHDNMYFPIYSGKHEGEWDLCVDCHIGGNFNSFSCIDCHEHDDPVEVGQQHQGVPGYQYNSPACYACHPDGED